MKINNLKMLQNIFYIEAYSTLLDHLVGYREAWEERKSEGKIGNE